MIDSSETGNVKCSWVSKQEWVALVSVHDIHIFLVVEGYFVKLFHINIDYGHFCHDFFVCSQEEEEVVSLITSNGRTAEEILNIVRTIKQCLVN